MMEQRGWRATADEDGQYCFAVNIEVESTLLYPPTADLCALQRQGHSRDRR